MGSVASAVCALYDTFAPGRGGRVAPRRSGARLGWQGWNPCKILHELPGEAFPKALWVNWVICLLTS